MSQQIHSGSRIVTTAGTAVRLSATKKDARMVIIQAPDSNTGNVYVRGVGEQGGVTLYPGTSVTLQSMGDNPHFDLKEIHLDAAVSGEGVALLWYAGD